MYSWEIQEFLKERGYYIGGDDLLKLISVEENPQLNHIVYNPYDNTYDMWDKDGNHFHFTPMPYEEAIEKQLVRRK